MCESKRNISAWSIKNADFFDDFKKQIHYLNSFDPKMDDCGLLQIKRRRKNPHEITISMAWCV